MTGMPAQTRTASDSAPGPPTPPDAASAAAGGTAARRLLTGTLLPVAVVVLVVVLIVLALRVPVPGRVSDLQKVAIGLALTAAVAAAVLARTAERTPRWQLAAGALMGAVTIACDRLAGHVNGTAQHAAAAAGAFGALVVMAISVHLVLALPDGRLTRARRIGQGPTAGARPAPPSLARRGCVAAAYAAATVAGLLLGIAGRPVGVPAGALLWAAVLAATLPAIRLRYQASAGRDRERLQWTGASAALAAGLALAAVVLHVLVAWPAPLAAAAAAAAVLLPLGMLVGQIRHLGAFGGRALVQLIAVTGGAAIVAASYLIAVLGLGGGPATTADRETLGLSILAAAVAAGGYLLARERLLAWAKHIVYGAREAPDEALRTFGSRLTRAIPMDELLLQLAESLRKTMALTLAEVYTGTDDVLERAVSVPDSGPRSILVTARERPVITRAGVSGSAWASVWVPALLDGREQSQLRVAPVSHAGQLLGLIVIERPPVGDSFTEDDDRVLTDLARQVGLAFHNAQLDSELRNTLDQLRAQAEALRESRARIVASGDAERRRLERDAAPPR